MKEIFNILFLCLIFNINISAQEQIEKNNFIDSLGQKQGYWIEYYENNTQKIKSISYYLNNKRNGTYYSFYNTGEIKSIIEFKQDKKNGEYRLYYLNGELKSYATYLNGQRIYFAKYHEDGNKFYEELEKDGNKVIKHFTKEGVVEGNTYD